MKWLLFFLLFPLMGMAQKRSFVNIGLEEGLAQSQVNMIHQDAKGYLWVATIGGLSRYDGQEIKNFYKNNGLLDNDVSVIAESKDGRLYFGCLGGFSIYEGKNFQSFSLPADLVQYNVTVLDEQGDSLLWIGTNGGGLLKFDLNDTAFTAQDLSLGSNIRWLEAETGLVATDEGLFKDGMLLDDILRDVKVTDVDQYEGQIWVSTLRNGIYILDGTWTHLSPEDYPMISSVRQMCTSQDGSLWLATRNGALSFKLGKWIRYSEENGLPYENIRYIYEDREGNIWLATNGLGIFRYAGDLFTTYTTGSPLMSDAMLSMVEGKGGALYLGMFNEGLQVMRNDGSVDRVLDLPKTDVWTLLMDRKGQIWAGTSTGLFRSRGDAFEEVFSDALPNTRITALYEDKDDKLWVGHRNGVSLIQDGTLVPFPLSDSLSTPQRVRSIVQRGADIYFGAENGLFQLKKGGEVVQYTEADGLSDNSLYSMCERNGVLWLGTKTGLLKADEEMTFQVVQLSEDDGPQSINFLYSSGDEELYIGTNKGLYVYDGQMSDGVDFQNFTRTDGLPSLETNLNAIYQVQNGDLYFGTSKGIVRFNEETMRSLGEERAPFLHIRDVLLWTNELDLARMDFEALDDEGLPQGLVLNPSENHLTFQFVGIKLSDPKSVKYQYRLEGADHEWSPVSRTGSVTYSALGSGDYTFMVRTVGGDRESEGGIQTFRFEILAPIYLRTWALLIEGLAIAMVLFLFFLWQRSEAAKETERIELGYKNKMYALEQQSLNSSMNRHFIFNALNAIQFYINKEEKREANRYLTSFAKLIRKNLDSSTEMWVGLKDELERTALYLDLEKMRFSGRFSYEIQLGEEVNPEVIRLPSMTLQPYLENSIWHGLLPKEEKGQLDIRISIEDSRLCIIIQDNGIGIKESLKSKGTYRTSHESRGLKITDDRMKLFNKMTGKPYEVKGPDDLIEEGKVKGTKTFIYIPMD